MSRGIFDSSIVACIDKLTFQFVLIQVVDNYFNNGRLVLDDEFLSDSYLSMQRDILQDDFQEIMEDDNSNDDELEYTLDDVLEKLVFDIDIYSELYNLPKFTITNNEWDKLFDTLANFYANKDLDSEFMTDMIELNRMTIARSMIYHDDTITLLSYIKSLKYIESDMLTIKNILDITKELEDEFERDDFLKLLENKDESFGNFNTIEYLKNNYDDYDDTKLDISLNKLKQVFNFKLGPEPLPINAYDNVIDFSKHLTKKRAKMNSNKD